MIYPTGKWQTVTFDFNDAGFTALNFSAVTQLNLVFQPLGYMQGNVKVYIDDFAVGNNGVVGQAAVVSPYFLGFSKQEIPINTSFTYNIKNAFDADNLNSNITFSAISSNPTVLPNPTFTNSPFLSNSYFNFTSGNGSVGDLQTSRLVNMVMTPNVNQFGMVTVTVTATAASQIAGATSVPYSYVFVVDVKRNVAPTIGTIPATLTIGSDRKTTIDLDNIFSGNGESAQTMTISGLSSDQSVLQNSQIVASYNGISLAGKLSFTPIPFSSPASKIFNLTVNIRDNGGVAIGGSNQTNYVIPVTVLPTFYNSPTIATISDQIDNIVTQGPRTIRIEPISDGNGGSRISSVSAVSGNLGILSNPTVSYKTGDNFALLTYNSLLVGTTNISVTATNFGAPLNSNGNSSFTTAFVMKAQNPSLAAYVEPMTITTVVGPNNADARSSTVSGTWYVEAQGTQQTVSINSGVFTNVMTKDGTVPGYFAGVWYKPFGGGELFDFATYPYLSVELSTTNTDGKVAIDLWDVNGVRYGLSSQQTITNGFATYTFCYTGVPTPGFDFSKVKTILFNFGVTPFNEGTGSWLPYNGTYSMRNLRLANSAVGAGSCTPPIPIVRIGDIPNPFHTTAQFGVKQVTLTGINAGSTPITGQNNNPVSLSTSGSFSPSIISFNTLTGVAVVQYTSPNTPSSGIIDVTGSASGSATTTKSFTVSVVLTPASQNIVVTNDLNANFADGRKGQTIDGSPFGICEILGEDGGSNQPDSYYQEIKEAGVKSMRVGIWDFEPKNDNNNPFVLDKTKLDYKAMGIDFFKKLHAAGVDYFFVTFFSPPSFVKYNNSHGVPNAPFQFSPGFVVNNTVDSSFYEEYAEYAVAFVQGVKEKSGVDIYGLSIGNEIQFNQTYQSVVYNTAQYVEIIRRIGRRLAAAGLKTFLWGAETLQAQDSGNNYLKAVQADPETRNYFGGYAIHAYAANGVGEAEPSWGSVVIDSRDSRSNGGLTLLRQSPIATVGPLSEPHNGNGDTGIPIYMTETSQGNLAPAEFTSWDNALKIFGGVSTAVKVGKNSGWFYIGINKEAKMFYTYKHVDKLVYPGARVIPVSQPAGTNTNAFRNPDGSVCVIMATNAADGMRNFSFGGPNMPSVVRAYLSVDNLFWQDLGTVTGNIVVPPNALLSLWGGGNSLVAASGVTVSGANTTNIVGGLIQYTANVGPSNLVDKTVSWSVITSTGNASINQDGLLTAISNGVVTVRGTSVATPTVFGQIVVTISGQYIKLTSLTVNGLGGVRNVVSASTLQMTVSGVTPTLAPLRDVTWTLNPVSGIASINANGLLTGITAGLVTVIGTSVDNITVTSRVVITVTSSSILVTSATISGQGGVNSIAVGGSTLNMSVIGFNPSNANTNTTPSWSVSNPVGVFATINATTGVLSSNNNGNGVVTVTGTFGSVTAIRLITLSNQNSAITSATLTGAPSLAISTLNGNMTFTGTFTRTDLSTGNGASSYSLIQSPIGIANFNNITAVLSANGTGNGFVTVTGVFGSINVNRVVTITGQVVPVTSATISGQGGVTTIATAGGTLSMSVIGFNPSNANTNTTPVWSVTNPAGVSSAINSGTGLLTAGNNGNGVVTVTGTFGSITATKLITISNQTQVVTSASINSGNTITVAGGSLNLIASYLPINANTNTILGWSINDPNGNANFNAGLGTIQAIKNGTVTITGSYGGGVTASQVITFSNQLTAITLSASVNTIIVNAGQLQINATFVPALSSTTGITWSCTTGSTISGTGMVQALLDGPVTITGTSVINPTIKGTYVVTNSNQTASLISVTSINISAGNTIVTAGGNLVLTGSVNPVNASNTNVSWSVTTSTSNVGRGISGNVITLTGLTNGNGVVTITATSISNPGVTASRIVTVSGQNIPVISGTISGLSGVKTIASFKGSLQLIGGYLPTNANTGTTLGWGSIVQNPIGIANFNPSNGVLSALGVNNGTVTISGNYAAGGIITPSIVVTISGQLLAVTSATISGQGGVNSIAVASGTLNMSVVGFNPSNANTNTVPTWSVANPVGVTSSINPTTGVLAAGNNGNGVVTVTGTFGSITATRMITLSNQSSPITSATLTGLPTLAISTLNGNITFSGAYTRADLSTGLGVNSYSINENPSGISSINNITGVLSANGSGNGSVTVTGTIGSIILSKIVTITGQIIQVTSITISSSSNQLAGASPIFMNTPIVVPSNAANTNVAWSILTIPGGGLATINSLGVVTGLSNGDGAATVVGTAMDGSGVKAYFPITISGQIYDVVGLTISGAGGNIISGNGIPKNIVSNFNPANATNKAINWSVLTTPGGGKATVSNLGEVTPLIDGNGLVTIVGVSQSNTNVTAFVVMTISGQTVSVSNIQITTSGSNTLTSNGQTENLSIVFTPNNSTQTNIEYSSEPQSVASVDASGQILARDNGVVTITATSLSNPSLKSTVVYTVSGQLVKTATATVSGGNVLNSTVTSSNIQLSFVSPQTNALSFEPAPIWSILGQQSSTQSSETNLVSINSLTGVITSNNRSNGLVTISGYLQNSSITSVMVLTVSNQREPVQSILAGDDLAISITGGNVQHVPFRFNPNTIGLLTDLDKKLVYTVVSGNSLLGVNEDGLLFSKDNGNGVARVKVSSAYDANVFDEIDVTLVNQTNSISMTTNTDGIDINNLVLPINSVIFLNAEFTPVNDINTNPIPFNRQDFVSYSSSNTSIASVTSLSGGTLRAIAVGVATITATYTNNPMLTTTFVVTVTDIPNSISNISLNATEFTLSPVPATEILYLNTKQDLGNGFIKIYNAEGRLVAEYNVPSTIGFAMNVAQFAKGYYNLVLTTNNSVTSKPFVK